MFFNFFYIQYNKKIVSQLEIISNSLLLLDQRISTNEEQVAQVLDYFKEIKD